MPRSGYTLPVFAVAAAKAALLHLYPHLNESISDKPQSSKPQSSNPRSVALDLLDDSGTANIPIQQVAQLGPNSALGITLSDPGDNLDLTRNMPIWAQVEMQVRSPDGLNALILEGGEGLGRSVVEDKPAIYSYARRLFAANLEPLLSPQQAIKITVILPEGRILADRTSNAAFGVVEGLSLLGTSGISKPLSAEQHFVEYQQVLRDKAARSPDLTFCIGSNGLRVADRLGIDPETVAQTGNWVGALLVEAGLQGVTSVHLLGYQGKLIKLAGGIFNTSSHLADAKLEIISAAVIQSGGDVTLATRVLTSQTADEAYQHLVSVGFAQPVFDRLSKLIAQKADRYVKKYANTQLNVTVTLFDRQGQIISSDLR